ncbi:MAG: hypothetical protein ACR2KK_06420 [Acidimicrobiales bacterium]
MPVIFLTAKDTTADKVQGLRLGSDDYATKPFSIGAPDVGVGAPNFPVGAIFASSSSGLVVAEDADEPAFSLAQPVRGRTGSRETPLGS